jgi:hypothetical protein
MTRRLRELDSPTAPLRERLRKVTLGSDEFEHDYAWDSSMDRSSSVSHPLVPYLSEFLPSPDESDFAALKTPRPSNEAVRRKQTFPLSILRLVLCLCVGGVFCDH